MTGKLTEQCLTQLSEKLLPTDHGNKYRDPQLDMMQRVGGLETVSSKYNFCIKSLSSRLKEFCRIRDRKSARARGDGGHKENNAF